jgi:transposase InsO family protein
MQRINIDSIGPLETDEFGYQYVLVTIDHFSKFTVLYPLKGLEALETARALLTHIGTFGCPDEISSDQGRQFVNTTVEQLFLLCDIQKITSIPYSHEQNGIVERVNLEIMRHLRAILFDASMEDSWSTCLPLVQRIINSNKHIYQRFPSGNPFWRCYSVRS